MERAFYQDVDDESVMNNPIMDHFSRDFDERLTTDDSVYPNSLLDHNNIEPARDCFIDPNLLPNNGNASMRSTTDRLLLSNLPFGQQVVQNYDQGDYDYPNSTMESPLTASSTRTHSFDSIDTDAPSSGAEQELVYVASPTQYSYHPDWYNQQVQGPGVTQAPQAATSSTGTVQEPGQYMGPAHILHNPVHEYNGYHQAQESEPIPTLQFANENPSTNAWETTPVQDPFPESGVPAFLSVQQPPLLKNEVPASTWPAVPALQESPARTKLAQMTIDFRDFRDYVATSVSRGPFLPQKMYRPHTEADKKRYVEDVTLQELIIFEHTFCDEWGISLPDALSCEPGVLKYPNDVFFEGLGPSVSIRIQWPGYNSQSKQIPTKDFKKEPGLITRQKLAKCVAKTVGQFMKKAVRQTDEDVPLGWRVGQVKFEDLMLVSLHHVSQGSWQPQICLRNPRAPEF